jgi:hypothetical protein
VVLRPPARSLRSIPWSTTIVCAAALSCAESDNPSRAESGNGAPLPARESAEAWRVSERGVGPVRVGMSVNEAEAALGAPLLRPRSLADCAYVRPSQGPAGLSFMVVQGRIARIDVDSATVATTAGARVGDSEARVRALYGERLIVSPHKYVEGHYLTVTPRDTGHRVVFETDGQRVTRYRAGRLPEVKWVERCG